MMYVPLTHLAAAASPNINCMSQLRKYILDSQSNRFLHFHYLSNNSIKKNKKGRDFVTKWKWSRGRL